MGSAGAMCTLSCLALVGILDKSWTVGKVVPGYVRALGGYVK